MKLDDLLGAILFTVVLGFVGYAMTEVVTKTPAAKKGIESLVLKK